MRYKQCIIDILKSNILKSIYFNFKMFPTKTALRLPILFYGNVVFRSLKGKVEIRSHVYTGMIKFGVREWYVTTARPQVTITNNGTIIFNGPIRFLQGSYIAVARNATLEFGSNGSLCGSDVKIMCFDHIHIGDNVRITWNVQLYDTSFHYIEIEGRPQESLKLTKPIILGNNIWIGNTTTISKGSVLPSDCVVASNSLVNKDLSSAKPYSLIAGVPAKVKCDGGFHRVWDKKQEKLLDEQFGYDRTHL